MAVGVILPVLLTSISLLARAHEHHAQLGDDEKDAPVDLILWIHIVVQATVWGVLFPIGMVLGITRSRWHVPLQSTGFALTATGYLLGHAHRGRQFLPGVHGSFASLLLIPMGAQFTLGVYLKLHIHEKSLRPTIVRMHGWLGKSFPLLAWVQMLFGVITLGRYCRTYELVTQCSGHYVMGSAFIGYGIAMAILPVIKEAWACRNERSTEWWDSWIMVFAGIVGILAGYRGMVTASRGMQNMTLGLLWLVGGFLGVLLSRSGKRNVVPAVTVLLTGWAMCAFDRTFPASRKVHAIFGYTLISVGLARIIEVCFVASEERAMDAEARRNEKALTAIMLLSTLFSKTATLCSTTAGVAFQKVFRHLIAFLLVAAGFIFMSATDEALETLEESSVSVAAFVSFTYSVALILYVYVLVLIHLYSTTGRNAINPPKADAIETTPRGLQSNWYARVPDGEVASPTQVVEDDD